MFNDKNPKSITVIGAGINGLVAANYLVRAGYRVTLLERSDRIGGACVSETVEVQGTQQDYALGASTLGLMQDFVWRETGLADRLQGWAATHPDLVFFPGIEQPTVIYDDAFQAAREFADKWGEQGDLAAFRADEDRVVRFLQAGYRAGQPPSVEDAVAELGADLTSLWITGSARTLLDHYLSAERTKVHLAMDVNESGPVSLSEPYSAFIIPMMSSGSVFGGHYGYVRGGIWQVTRELDRINQELGVELVLSCTVHEVDTKTGIVRYEKSSTTQTLHSDHVVFATDPQTAASLTGDSMLIEHTARERVLGTAGKLNLMFRKPVQWKHGSENPESDTAFRYILRWTRWQTLKQRLWRSWTGMTSFRATSRFIAKAQRCVTCFRKAGAGSSSLLTPTIFSYQISLLQHLHGGHSLFVGPIFGDFVGTFSKHRLQPL